VSDSFNAIRACAIALLAGAVLQAGGVSAGNGEVIDWRTVKSGETLTRSADAFDVAQLFVTLVGPEQAIVSIKGDVADAPAFESPKPRISAYMANASGARRRSFDAGPFRVFVEPHDDDDAAQAAFVERLARLTATLPGGGR